MPLARGLRLRDTATRRSWRKRHAFDQAQRGTTDQRLQAHRTATKHESAHVTQIRTADNAMQATTPPRCSAADSPRLCRCSSVLSVAGLPHRAAVAAYCCVCGECVRWRASVRGQAEEREGERGGEGRRVRDDTHTAAEAPRVQAGSEVGGTAGCVDRLGTLYIDWSALPSAYSFAIFV